MVQPCHNTQSRDSSAGYEFSAKSTWQTKVYLMAINEKVFKCQTNTADNKNRTFW